MRSKIIVSNSNVLGGQTVFAGTRVPVQTFIDYLESGQTVQDFLKGFPTVSRTKVISFLEEVKEQLLVKA